MRMKNEFSRAIIVIVAMHTMGFSTLAHDFEVDGIYYNILDETAKTVEVTYQGVSYKSYSDEYVGTIVIPKYVSYQNQDYDVTKIKNSAFSGCENVTKIDIPNTVLKIEDYAFHACLGLKEVTIPNSIKTIGMGAFYNCNSLEVVNITDLSAWCMIDFEWDFQANPLYYGKLRLNGEDIKDLVIPDNITKIKKHAFVGCDNFRSVTFPNTIESIESYAFAYANGITDIELPNSLITIESSAFLACLGLRSVTFPKSLRTIKDCAFYYCQELEKVEFKEGLISIENGAFWDCKKLSSVILPNSLTNIGEYSFFASGLKTIVLGSSLEKIGPSAFACCDISSITSLNPICPKCEEEVYSEYCVFDGSYSATLIVPEGTKMAYASADEWCKFTNIQEIAGVEGIAVDNNATEIACYDIHGRKLNEPAKGINIVKMSDGSTYKELVK